MKGRNRKRTVTLTFVLLIILIPLISPITTELAKGQTDDQISISFDPRPNEPPSAPVNPDPPNGSVDVGVSVTLSVYVYDESSSTVDVYFYNGLDNALIGVDYNVSAWTSTATVIWSGLQYETNYSWYVVVNDSEYENTSETWTFTTGPNQPSTIHNNEYPSNTSTNVERQVTCHIEVSDEGADLMTIYWYENSAGSWILRQTNSSVGNGMYYWTFSQASSYSTTYYWKVAVNDGIANTTAVYYFTTKPQSSAPPSTPSAPPNQKPIANITGPFTGYVNQTLIFSAKYSYDPDGIITHYRGDFDNDGLFDTDWIEDILMTHTYSRPDNYTVKLQVKDNDGAISTDSYIIIIKQLEPPLQLPVAQANGPYMSFTNENITFNSAGSYDPDGIIIVNYTWDFGDKNTSYMENPIHSYAKQGNYIVFLTVVDNDNLSNTAIASIYIRDPEPEEEKEQSLPILSILLMAIIATIMPVFILKSKRRRRQIYYYMRNKLNNIHNIESKANEPLSGLNYYIRNKLNNVHNIESKANEPLSGLDSKNNKEIKKEKLEQSLRKKR